jgi:hypothetical protein
MLGYLVEIHKSDNFSPASWLSSVNTLLIPNVGDIISFNTYREKCFKFYSEAKVIARHFCYERDWAQKVLLVVEVLNSENSIAPLGFDDVDVCSWDEYEETIEKLSAEDLKACLIKEAHIRFKAEMALRYSGHRLDSDGCWVKG